MALSFIRTIVLYIAVTTALRIMGKRQLGELQPAELVIAFMISDLASVPMQSKSLPLADGLVPIFTLVALELIFSIGTLKSEKLRLLLTGRPLEIISRGQLIEKNLRKLRLDTDDVLEQLRINGYGSVGEIYSASIETNGQISFIPYEAERCAKAKDVGADAVQSMKVYTIIADGNLRAKNLAKIGANEAWLKSQLKKYNLDGWENVLLMTADEDKKIFLQIGDK